MFGEKGAKEGSANSSIPKKNPSSGLDAQIIWGNPSLLLSYFFHNV